MGAADHLQVPRQHGLFTHHGIDLGDGSVAHYLEGREILRSSIKDFCGGQTHSVVIHENASSNGLTLRRAMSRIGEQNYNLLFNNCEHFANWCKTGKHRSKQMEEWLQSSSIRSIAIGQLIPAAFFSGLNLLLAKGLEDEFSRKKAKQAIDHLEQLRKVIVRKLESTLEEIENWLKAERNSNISQNNYEIKQKLLFQGQDLADQLNTLENVEAQINSLLNKAEPKT